MAENIHYGKSRDNGAPAFFHNTRVCQILIDELNIYEPDMIITALLHDVLASREEISPRILDYNFGPYVMLMVETLSRELTPQIFDTPIARELRISFHDGLIIKLAECLDDLRCIGFDPLYNPIHYIQKISERYLSVAENIDNKHLIYLTNELKKERNKIIG
jgi:(p)ppGpp synthase/HD superfamily hydrolase